MVTEAKEKKNLKLSNWQLFLLDRLNSLYEKRILCDLTLRFNDEESIQVHKVILMACSTFFEHLHSSPPTGILLHMPSSMKIEHVRPIINFIYTGRLEYMPEDKPHILLAAKHLGITVLTDLLNVKPQPLVSKKKIAYDNSYNKYLHKHVPSPTTELSSSPTSHHLPVDSSASPLQPNPVSSSSLALPGKKLPIWKKRTSLQLPEEFYQSVNNFRQPQPASIVEEPPRPTRFEWPDEEVLPDISLSQCFQMNSCENLSYVSSVIVKPVDDPKPVITEDSINKMPETTPVIQRGVKRARFSEVVKGRGDDDDDYDDEHFETIHDLEDDTEEEETTSNTEVRSLSTPPKPILKNHEMSTPTPSKKVRFAVSTDNGTSLNSEPQTTVKDLPSLSAPPHSQVTTSPISIASQASSTTTVSSSPSCAATPVSHAKIINEIIKKYPDLMKNNKNIKLKIQGGTSPSSTTQNTVAVDNKDRKNETKVQYILMKSDLANLKKEIDNGVSVAAENRTGPWVCPSCADDEGPLNFTTYYTYRKHLQEVHNERIDARICEHCGFKASKRNLHLYHLYTKHDIPPPRNINFPKCDQCNYIALSESLLIKHRSNHMGMNKEFVCRLCNAAFKSNGALMGHMQTNLHQFDQATKKEYECEYCGRTFNRNINLKAHIRTSHQEENRKMYDDEDKADDSPEVEVVPEQRNTNVMEVIEVPVFESVPAGNKTLYLPQGMTILAESPAVPLMPSSESEAMSNVATGIATSINLTDRNIPSDVIVLNDHSEIILRGTPAYVLNQDGTYSVQEYIVPEIMGDSGQVYTTALVSTAPTTGISYVNSDNISIITPGTDHTYADGAKVNGNVNTGAQVSLVSSNGPTVIASQVQVSQPSQSIIVQEPIIMSADWVQSIGTSQAQNINIQGQKVEIVAAPVTQTPATHPVESGAQTKTAQNLVSDWGDLEDDNQEDSQDGEDESEMKPSRPTIELDVSSEVDM